MYAKPMGYNRSVEPGKNGQRVETRKRHRLVRVIRIRACWVRVWFHLRFQQIQHYRKTIHLPQSQILIFSFRKTESACSVRLRRYPCQTYFNLQLLKWHNAKCTNSHPHTCKHCSHPTCVPSMVGSLPPPHSVLTHSLRPPSAHRGASAW